MDSALGCSRSIKAKEEGNMWIKFLEYCICVAQQPPTAIWLPCTGFGVLRTTYKIRITTLTTIVMTVVVVVIVVVLSVVLLVEIWGRQPPHLILAVALRLPYLAAVLEGLKRAATLGWFDRRIRSTKPPGRKSKAASPDKGHHGSAPEATCTFM